MVIDTQDFFIDRQTKQSLEFIFGIIVGMTESQ